MTALARRAPPDPYERIAELEEEVAYLRSELGLAVDAVRLDVVCEAFRATAQQGRIILALHGAHPRLMTKAALHAAMYGPREATSEPKILDVQMCKIRKHAGQGFIRTAWGTGYALTEAGAARVKAALEGAG